MSKFTYWVGHSFIGLTCSLVLRTVTRRAIAYIHKSQREDGSWLGSWGICFTYASMFALESLSLNGETYDSSESVRKACEFLRSKQKLDGGWGETYMVRSLLIAHIFVSFSDGIHRVVSPVVTRNIRNHKLFRLPGPC